MIVRQVTLLPQPDSPTIRASSPFSIEKEMPSTALTIPSSRAEGRREVANLEEAPSGSRATIRGSIQA